MLQWLIDHLLPLLGAGSVGGGLVAGAVAVKRARAERDRAEAERQRAEAERQRAEVDRQRAEVERDTGIAPSLLKELREAREEMRREIVRRDETIETHAVKIDELGYDLADCQEKHARAEERHADCTQRTEQLEERWDRERSILHDAVTKLSISVESTATSPEARAQARAVRRSISSPEMSAYRADPVSAIEVEFFGDDEQ